MFRLSKWPINMPTIWFYFHFSIWELFSVNTGVRHCCDVLYCAVAAAARTGPFINEIAVRSIP